MAVPALSALRASFQRKGLYYMTAAVSADRMISPEEVLRATGLVDGFMTYRAEEGLRGNVRAISAHVRDRGVDTLVYLPQPERTVAEVMRDRVFFGSCGIRNLIGFEKALANARRRAGG